MKPLTLITTQTMRGVSVVCIIAFVICYVQAQNNWCQSSKCATPTLMDIATFNTVNGSTGVLTVSSDGSYCISSDKGITWTYREGGRPLGGLTSIASTLTAALVNQSLLITGSNCRGLQTGDGFNYVSTDAPCVNNFVVSAMSPNGLYAAATDTYNRFWFSRDAGRTWPAVSTLWSGLQYNKYAVTMLNFATDDILVAVGGYVSSVAASTSFSKGSSHPLFLWSLDGGVTIRNMYIYHPSSGLYLNDVSCVSLSCLVVGSLTTVYQVAFSSLDADPTITQLISPATGVVRRLELSAVWCVTSLQCWIGGAQTFLAMTTDGGQSWSNAVFSSTYSAFIYSIRCSDANNCFLIMREGLVYTNSGVCTSNSIPPIPIAGFAAGSAISPSMILVALAACASLLFAL